MKKFTFLILASLTYSLAGYAQYDFGTPNQVEEETTDKPVRIHKYTHDSKAVQSSAWFNFFADIRDFWGLDVSFFRSTLFADSTVYVQNGTSFDFAFKHSYGQSFDPTSPYHEISISEAADYSLDSISIPYMYFRPQKANPDTLIISIFRESQLNINPSPGWSTPRSYANAPYDTVANKGLNPDKEIVYILEDKDERMNAADLLKVEVDMDFSPGEILAATISYFPGNPVNPGDTMGNTIAPFGPQTRNAFNYYDGLDKSASIDNGYYNMGQWITTPIAYNLLGSTNGWEGSYVPGVAYGNMGGGVRHMDINFKITYDDFTGISEEGINRFGFALFPNPASNTISFNHELVGTSQASVQIFNLTGSLLKEVRLNSGAKRTEVDINKLNPGIYFAKLIVDNEEAAAAKFIVE